MTEQATKSVELDQSLDVLDATIDDLADFVPFKPFPVGDYKFQFSWEQIEVGDSNLPAVLVTLLLQEVVALQHPDEIAPEVGSKVTFSYVLRKKDGERNTIGEGQLKAQILSPLQEAFGGQKTSEILRAGDGCSVIATLAVRHYKSKETGERLSSNTIKALVVDL